MVFFINRGARRLPPVDAKNFLKDFAVNNLNPRLKTVEKMRNLEIADILRMAADMLEIKGENPFKVKAYRQAVLTLETLPGDAGRMLRHGKLENIPGIGKGLAEKIEEIVSTGHLKYLEELRKSLPEGLVKMLEIPNVGPKTVHALFENLGIESIDELEKAASEGRIRNLEHFGEKTEQNILRGIELLKRRSGRMLLGSALSLGESVVERLLGLEQVEKAALAGSLRRMRETIGDIDVLAVSSDSAPVMDFFAGLPEVTQVLSRGGTKASVIMENRVQVDLRIVPSESYGAALQYFTGSKQHNVKLRETAARKGLKLNEYGVFDSKTGKKIAGEDEPGFYAVAGLSFIPPELREDRGEIEAAAGGGLPELVETSDIRGDLHVHSLWSDGTDSVYEIAREAEAFGYEYIAVCDHSSSLKVAGGLSPEEKYRQIEEIREVNRKLPGITVLAGAEVDILNNGLLDYGADLLAELDLVIAALHTGFRQDGETLTSRVLRAMNNRYVNIIAHPTGRLLQQREPYAIDVGRIIEEAADTGTFLELNCFPDRLDLNDADCRRAGEAGVRVALGSDSHNRLQLGVVRFGVGTARRGWLGKEDVVNTLGAAEITALLLQKRKK